MAMGHGEGRDGSGTVLFHTRVATERCYEQLDGLLRGALRVTERVDTGPHPMEMLMGLVQIAVQTVDVAHSADSGVREARLRGWALAKGEIAPKDPRARAVATRILELMDEAGRLEDQWLV